MAGISLNESRISLGTSKFSNTCAICVESTRINRTDREMPAQYAACRASQPMTLDRSISSRLKYAGASRYFRSHFFAWRS